jgi:hypothetical protein
MSFSNGNTLAAFCTMKFSKSSRRRETTQTVSLHANCGLVWALQTQDHVLTIPKYVEE